MPFQFVLPLSRKFKHILSSGVYAKAIWGDSSEYQQHTVENLL